MSLNEYQKSDYFQALKTCLGIWKNYTFNNFEALEKLLQIANFDTEDYRQIIDISLQFYQGYIAQFIVDNPLCGKINISESKLREIKNLCEELD